ncbi:MAG TPA: hypothetical protein VGK36_21760 [Candidatus Angelobacter sp.]|jgi:hypothetical protein
MSIAGIASNFLLNSLSPKQASLQQFKDEFKQLGQDLQAGNLKGAQDDYAQLQQIEQQKNSSTSPSNSTSSVAQLFAQLGKDLTSGSTSSAQDDFNDIMKAIQSSSGSSGVHHHHHHGGGGSSSQTSAVQNDLNSLGQALQSGNLSAAQAAYTSVQTDLQSIGVGAVTSGAVSASA